MDIARTDIPAPSRTSLPIQHGSISTPIADKPAQATKTLRKLKHGERHHVLSCQPQSYQRAQHFWQQTRDFGEINAKGAEDTHPPSCTEERRCCEQDLRAQGSHTRVPGRRVPAVCSRANTRAQPCRGYFTVGVSRSVPDPSQRCSGAGQAMRAVPGGCKAKPALAAAPRSGTAGPSPAEGLHPLFPNPSSLEIPHKPGHCGLGLRLGVPRPTLRGNEPAR